MKFTEELYTYVEKMWKDFCEHPFVDGIGSGNLEREKFSFYMVQDYLYLLDYAKVFSLGVVKSEDETTMAKFANLANGILNTEMSLHRRYMKELGIDSSYLEKAKKSLHNASYTNYMLAVSYSGGIPEIAVSLLSCLWSYEVIGHYLFEKYGLKNSFYSKWIEAYISEEYHELNIWLLDLVDRHTQNLTETQKEKLIEIFVNTSRYEGLFWDMAYSGEM